MQTEFISLASSIGIFYYYTFQKEIQITWKFIKRDISVTIIPASLFTIAAWLSNSGSLNELFLDLVRAFVYFFLFIYTSVLPNQILGVEEDKINKPDRPIAAGLVSYTGAKNRYLASMIVFALVGWSFGVLEWTLLWQGLILLYNEGGWSQHWFSKNLGNGLGVVTQLAAAWQMITPLTQASLSWIFIIAFLVFVLVPLQDLRDIEGDKLLNRQTLPIAFGEQNTRVFLSFIFLIAPFFVHFILMIPAGYKWKVLLCDIAQALICWVVSARVIFCRSPQADHDSYMLFTYWYCLMLASASVVL
jgi:4-hydroxybenzoate polyprenyltransferase